MEPQNITFPPFDAMTPEEQQEIGAFAGQQVTNGAQAEAFSRYIGGHLAAVNDGKTYSETSGEARAEGLDPDVAAELQGKADTLFKGETLRSILLNAYGWWTVATIALFAGYAMVALGILLGVLALLGFRHAKRAQVERTAGSNGHVTAGHDAGHGLRLAPTAQASNDRPGQPRAVVRFCHPEGILEVAPPRGPARMVRG